jgi:hypothetical protein
LSLFKGNEDGDVLKIDVESPEVEELNRLITETFPCKDKYPTFEPHVTLAFLNPEYSHLYVNEGSKAFEHRGQPCGIGQNAARDGCIPNKPEAPQTQQSQITNDRQLSVVSSVDLAGGKVDIQYDPEVTSQEVAAKAAKWISSLPPRELAKMKLCKQRKE